MRSIVYVSCVNRLWVIFCSHLGTGTSAALEFGLSWPGRRKMATVVLNLCDFVDGNGNATFELV